jgi:predicted dinucleotide-binding enzyme
MNMEIVMIGSGNVAAVLGRKFKAAGHSIAQVYSRNASEASKLAYEWDTESTNYISLINKTADVYLIAVSDEAIDDVVRELKLPGRVVAHTAASAPSWCFLSAAKPSQGNDQPSRHPGFL